MFYLILKKRRNICQKYGESCYLFIFLHLNFRKAYLDCHLDSMSGYSEDHLREKLIKVFHLSSSASDPEKKSKLYLHQVAGCKTYIGTGTYWVVFWIRGSVSFLASLIRIRQSEVRIIGSGSSNQQAKILRKPMVSTVYCFQCFVTSFWLYLWRMMLMYRLKVPVMN